MDQIADQQAAGRQTAGAQTPPSAALRPRWHREGCRYDLPYPASA